MRGDKLMSPVCAAEGEVMANRIARCRHREDGHGFYTKHLESRTVLYDKYGNDGYGSVELIRGGEIAYCDNCNARLGHVRTVGDEGKIIIIPNHAR